MGACSSVKESEWQIQAEIIESRALSASGIPLAEWETSYVEINKDGRPLNVRTIMHGDLEAPVLVMTNAFGVSVSNMFLIFKQLSEHYRIILFDNLNMGLNTRRNECYGLED